MKKRHEQKLIVLSIALFLIFNIPFVLIFNMEGAIFGVPVFYFSVFSIWLLSIVISYIVLKRHYE
jgi:O-antigen/teichoic acid export membrane protein